MERDLSVGNPLTATSLVAWATDQRDMLPHLETLTRYAGEAQSIVEFGTRGGVSTWAFLDGLPADGHMWSMDIEDCVVPPRVSSDPRWTFIQGDDMDPLAQRQLPGGADLVFIDTSHEYVHTGKELLLALTFGPSRIICHDAMWVGVTQAVAEFCSAYGWFATIDIAGDSQGDFSLATLEPI